MSSVLLPFYNPKRHPWLKLVSALNVSSPFCFVKLTVLQTYVVRDEGVKEDAHRRGEPLGNKPPLSPKHKQAGCVPCHTGLPNKGTASDVAGIVSATMFRNTVRERRIVTPGRRNTKLKGHAHRVKCLCVSGVVGRRLFDIKILCY